MDVPEMSFSRVEATDGVHEFVHLVPNHDIYQHQLSENCWCVPEESPVEPDVFYHEAADDRDAYLEGTRKPH